MGRQGWSTGIKESQNDLFTSQEWSMPRKAGGPEYVSALELTPAL